MRFSLFALFGFISLISTAENGMDERQRAWTLMTFELHYCLTPGGCKFNDTSTNKVIFTMRQRFSNGTEGDERDLSRDYWSDVKCSTEWPQFTQGPSTWMKCTQPDPHWHSSDFNPQWKFVGEPLGKKFPFEGKKTIAVSVQYPRGERPKGRYGLK
jgi:hypothetical protein